MGLGFNLFRVAVMAGKEIQRTYELSKLQSNHVWTAAEIEAERVLREKNDWDDKYKVLPNSECFNGNFIYVVIIAFTLSIVFNGFDLIQSVPSFIKLLLLPVTLGLSIGLPIFVIMRGFDQHKKLKCIASECSRLKDARCDNDYKLDIVVYLNNIMVRNNCIIFQVMSMLFLFMGMKFALYNYIQPIEPLKLIYFQHPIIILAMLSLVCLLSSIGLSQYIAKVIVNNPKKLDQYLRAIK